MKYLLASLMGLCLFPLIAACGGGGSGAQSVIAGVVPTPPPSQFDYRDYAPYKQSVTRYTREDKWVAFVLEPNVIDVQWGDSIEEHRIRDINGTSWVLLDAYRDAKLGLRYAVQVTKAEWAYQGHPWQDITTPDTTPYSPVLFTGAYTLRQWGIIKGDPSSPVPDKKFFWQHTITPMNAVTNVCWADTLTSTRPVLRQQEVWWDSEQGWTDRGTGQLGPDGVPTGADIKYVFWQDMAKDAGYLWTASTGQCLLR